MRLAPSRIVLLALLGGVVGPIGDHGHVVSGTTRYLERGGPFVWDSALWFIALVAAATVATAELRLRLAPARAGGRSADGIAAVALVAGVYAVTALVHDAPLGPATTLIVCLGALTWVALGADPPAAWCGLAAAIGGTAVEAGLVAAGVFAYDDRIDTLAGVAPWLPALYFAFGCSAARLGELLSGRR